MPPKKSKKGGSSAESSGGDWLASLARQSTASDVVQSTSKRKGAKGGAQQSPHHTTTKEERIQRREQKKLERQERKRVAEEKRDAKKLLLLQKKRKRNERGGTEQIIRNTSTSPIIDEPRKRKGKRGGMTEFSKRALVKFSTPQTCINTYDADVGLRSLVWYKSAEIKQFKEDRLIDTFKIMNKEEIRKNDEEICWWGLERLIVPSVGLKTMRARDQVKQVVLHKQDKAHLDRQFKAASEWAAQVAQEKAIYYSSHLSDNGSSI